MKKIILVVPFFSFQAFACDILKVYDAVNNFAKSRSAIEYSIGGYSSGNLPFSFTLPDRIECHHVGSNYQLILLLKSPQIPSGYNAFGLKNGRSVVFKTASQTFNDGENLLKFVESPATANSKEVHLDLVTKVAKLNNFHRADLSAGTEFACQY